MFVKLKIPSEKLISFLLTNSSRQILKIKHIPLFKKTRILKHRDLTDYRDLTEGINSKPQILKSCFINIYQSCSCKFYTK